VSDDDATGYDLDVAVIGQGVITGRKVAAGERPNVGRLQFGRPATPANVKLAARFYPEVDERELAGFEGYWVDRGSGALFTPMLHDPLLSERPDQQPVSWFAQVDGQLVFLERCESPSTLEELEAGQEAVAERAAAEEEAAARCGQSDRSAPSRSRTSTAAVATS
jgi:hypothetical protein